MQAAPNASWGTTFNFDGALFYPLGPCNASEIVELKKEIEQFSAKLQPAGKALHVGMYFSHMGGCDNNHTSV